MMGDMMVGKKKILFLLIFITSLCSSDGCWMEDVNNWLLPVNVNVYDTFRGNILVRNVRDIADIDDIIYGEGFNSGPYLTITLTDSQLVISTNDAFENYEENETSEQIAVTVRFRCTSGSITPLLFLIDVVDTNNNAPQFLPSNEFVYTIAAPLPPGSLITECFGGLLVRDIDLTTERIDFTIEENPYFRISYDADASTTPKQFIAVLRTSTFIRSLPQPITLQITATDVDRTNDPPLSTTATVTFTGDTGFVLPDEPVFTQAFYLANYIDGNQLLQSEPISLQSGFDQLVRYSLEGEFADNFELITNENQVSVRVVTPLSATALREKQIFLALSANREYTSGASATIVVQLPETEPLEFERAHYGGTIENNILRAPQLTLMKGYDGQTVSVEVLSDYATYFTANIQGNIITLSMGPLTESIIDQNNVISLEVVASTEVNSARTILTLEIIKDDNVTPVFNKPMYTGSYNTEAGLTLEQIVFDQGYDETVGLSLEGDNSNLFTIRQEGPVVTLTTTGIPPTIFSQQRILLALQATKPRTVGASAAILITLPEARQLGFEESTYRASLQDNVLSVEPLALNTGYDENVVFTLRGEHATYFDIMSERNQVIITLSTLAPIPDNIIRENDHLILTVEASGLNAVTTTTTVLVYVIKEDLTTPVFTRNIYYGTYRGTSDLEVDTINLAQGFGNDVAFELQGELAQYFQISATGNNVRVSLRSTIPEDIIFTEKVFVLNIIANKPLTVGANAAIVIRFPSDLTDYQEMIFEEYTYIAEVENNNLRAGNIILTSGYRPDTEFLLFGEYSDYFRITSNGNVVSLTLGTPLPINEIRSSFIVLEIEARRERAISAWTSIVVDIIRSESQPMTFNSPYYQGVYEEETATLSVDVISLEYGYDETVIFALEGENAQLFSIVPTSSNTLTITSAGPIPSEVLQNQNHILLTIAASKPGAITTRAAIFIHIKRESAGSVILGFDQMSYIGSIRENEITMDQITLIENYGEDVEFSIHGDLASYFAFSQLGSGVVRISLRTPIPDQMIPANRMIVLQIRAIAPQALPAHATILLQAIVEDDQPSPPQLVFGSAFYTGSYTASTGLNFATPISLSEGYDQTVEFVLEGDHAQWFEAVVTGNSVTLRQTSPIPSAVLANNNQLVFVIAAQRPGSTTARATIVISLTDEVTEGSILGFDQITYEGSVRDNEVTLSQITLIEGYSQDVAFSLHGDLASYFAFSQLGSGVVRISLRTPIPDQMIPANRMIVLQIRAIAPQALPAHATILLQAIVEDDQPSPPQLVFGSAFYTGSYTASTGLNFATPISLTEGYDQTVEFVLEGDHAQWFEAVVTGNSVTLRQTSPIPSAVLANNNQLVFVIAAQRPGSTTARATIVISLTDEVTEGSILGFDQITYEGSVRDNEVTLSQITLIEGYSQDVAFSLHGDLASYFAFSQLGSGVVRISLRTPIPDQMIPANRMIVLQIRAIAPQALPAHATILLQAIVEDDQPSPPQLVFGSAFYTGSYTASTGLNFATPISLSEGYDQTVEFVLEGDHAQWFEAVVTGNSVTLRQTSPIPSAVLANNNQLVFVIAAQRPGSTTARATIVISLTDEVTEGSILGFDQITYEGSVRDNEVTLSQITLIEGYSQDVAFSLHGDLASYFAFSQLGSGVVRISLRTPIPDQMIPANRMIVLQIRAIAPQALPAHATILLQAIVEDDQPSPPQLVFGSAFYTGSYTASTGLNFATPISLSEGYDQTVEFVLEGDHAQWFEAVVTGNSVTLRQTSPIPSAVLANNNQLVFVIAAQRPGSTTARATIVISLTDEVTEGSILGFDQITYEGSVRDNEVTLSQITLIEGYSQDVAFSLHGDLASYFAFSQLGSGVVRISLRTPIPDQMIPANRMIVLQIRAIAPQALPAHATILLQAIVEDDQPSPPQLVFGSAFYTGSYTASTGLNFATPISLSEGYDQTVEFVLEGDHAQWFEAVVTGNSVTLRQTSPIPSAVLANNNQLVFVIAAQRPGSTTARATIVISLTDEVTEGSILGFDQITYEGSVRDNEVTLSQITLIEGYSQDVAFSLHGDLASYFAFSQLGSGVVRISLRTPIPDQMIPANRMIVLQIRAIAPQALPAHATILLQAIVEDDQPSPPQLVFGSAFYTGSYTASTGLNFATPISLSEGYDQTVEFVLEGDHAQWFEAVVTGNSVTLRQTSPIPSAVLANNNQLVFVIAAQRPGSTTARATIVISLTDEVTEGSILGFDQITYEGSVRDNEVTLSQITLIEGYSQDVAFSLHGDLASYFAFSQLGSGVVRISLRTPIPDQMIPANRMIVLQIRAIAPQALPAHATILLQAIVEDDQPSPPQLVFGSAFYTGSYTASTGLNFATPISLSEGYDQTVEFVLEGDHAQWFEAVVTGNSITLRQTSPIPSAVLANNNQLVFVIAAQRPGSTTARATIVISLTDDVTDGLILGFDQITYEGSVRDTELTLSQITLIEGYSQDVAFSLHGDLASYFAFSQLGSGVVRISLRTPIPDQMIPANRMIVLQIRAIAPQALPAHATILLQAIVEDDQPSPPQLVFGSAFYTGSYTASTGLNFATPISLTEGYDQTVEFVLEGDHAQWFEAVVTGNSVTLRQTSPIPSAVLANNNQLVFVIAAQRPGSTTARATIVISLTDDSQTGEDVSFEKLVYDGIIQQSTVQHEIIRINNFDEVNVGLYGVYSSLFTARVTNGVVTVQASGSLTLPEDVTQVILELHAASARAILLLNVVQSDVPVLPSVTFSSPSYVVNVNVAQTGLIGRVQATADNGEQLTYSIQTDNAHLQSRISINNDGELFLFAQANSGVYTFRVIATTVITQAEGTAAVHLTVEAVTECGDDNPVVPPLIILDRDEEEPHSNLVLSNTGEYEGCQFSLTNRWPLDQNWLYVDENGLHARSIDREHESIAFMALSQVQVELLLHCATDNNIRTKRSQRTDWLGPYDYGSNRWILTESISYNARRSFVNLIVNDINDNAPIFIGKELEPIAVGYPVGELEERILPRSLAELQATDADIGENAALMYSSLDDVLAVAPTTGFVHVRTGAQLQDNQRLTVRATDRNGEGLTGTIDILVKLLNLSNIAVVTVQNAFLNDEKTVLTKLSEAVGYEIKTLRSVVISENLDDNDDNLRNMRDTGSAGASLLLYVYGLIQREPVGVDRLAADINNNAAVANVVSTVSLEDHLPDEIIITQRDTGLLVATIILSILLFIMIVLVAVWFFLRWRRKNNYNEFTDENSMTSSRGSVGQLAKQETPKPRLNIEELKRSERRLQDMLNAPIEEVTVEPLTPRREAPVESIVDFSAPESNVPIVIQSIDKLKDAEDSDDDEFGEKSGTRRKSVVTFNENVEKIIHVEDNTDTVSSQSGYEIYKL
ncbi:uncharacterized protein LOC142973004 [Anticarsia gemmatalis]|uniref:uncharacterized protein LOC142973004 n=1 Tax=Anticarsia gemmatalis TaxID=129554 RepID=UPI003F75D4C9